MLISMVLHYSLFSKSESQNMTASSIKSLCLQPLHPPTDTDMEPLSNQWQVKCVELSPKQHE